MNPRANIPEAFVYNCWYVAAWGEEVTRAPMRRVILEEPIVFYRRLDGTAVALADRCVHRAYPLSRGKLHGDAIECGYHGFIFDSCGTCTWVPGQASIPKSARVAAYPVVESGPYLWIWMGEPEAADRSMIPDHQWTFDPQWRTVKDMATVRARFGLLLDNLMDLSHETWIHEGTIGTQEVADTPITTDVTKPIVRTIKHMQGVPVPPFYQQTGLSGLIDRWQDIECNVPSFYTLHVRVAPQGAGDDRAFFTKVIYGITPETKRSTHDFWAISRNRNLDQPAWRDRGMIDFQNAVLREDVIALEALEASLPEDGQWQELSINLDRAGLQWRRVYNDRLAQERAVSERSALDAIGSSQAAEPNVPA